jgi:hypothetical protein
MRTVDFDTLNLHWLQPSRTHNLDSTCSPNKALQLTIFPLLRNGKTAAELCVRTSDGGKMMTNLTRRTLLRGVTTLKAAATLPRLRICDVVQGLGTNRIQETGR